MIRASGVGAWSRALRDGLPAVALASALLFSGCCTVGGSALGHAADVATRPSTRFPCAQSKNALKRGGRVLVLLADGREAKGRMLECRCEADSLLTIAPDRGASLVRDTAPRSISVTPDQVRFVESLRYRWTAVGAFFGLCGDAALVWAFFHTDLGLR